MPLRRYFVPSVSFGAAAFVIAAGVLLRSEVVIALAIAPIAVIVWWFKIGVGVEPWPQPVPQCYPDRSTSPTVPRTIALLEQERHALQRVTPVLVFALALAVAALVWCVFAIISMNESLR